MESGNYLIDRETLGNFIDELIKNKPLSVNSTEELNAFREKSMRELDDQIATAIFGSLTDEQGAELDHLLDSDAGSEQPYQDFFNKIGLDIEKITTDTMQTYAANFLGGQNAE